MEINKDALTLEDCVYLYEKKGNEIVINDGKVVEIIEQS